MKSTGSCGEVGVHTIRRKAPVFIKLPTFIYVAVLLPQSSPSKTRSLSAHGKPQELLQNGVKVTQRCCWVDYWTAELESVL